MQQSYTKNYLKIYFWFGVSFVLNFLALFIVVPYLSSQPAIYGLYSICLGTAVFLTYADLGFVSAGTKYAAEYFAQGDKKKEVEIIGFTGFVLSIFLVLLMAFFYYCSLNPGFIIRNLIDARDISIATSLFLILAISVPNTLLQRVLQIIFSIRLQEYVIQRINVVGSAIRIASVSIFFSNGSYNIVGYYAFTQIILFIVSLVSIAIARYSYSYDFLGLIKSFRYKKEVFRKVRPLALSSLFLTISWIIYYEIDPFVIGKISGAEKVGIFAIGLTLLGFFRSVFGIIFSPFTARFNHFISQGNVAGLKVFYFHITKMSAFFVVLPIISIMIFARPFVFTWVGGQYQGSVVIVQWLLLCNLFAFITYPAAMLMMGLERIKEMYVVSSLIPIVYWVGVAAAYSSLGLTSLAVFKCVAFFISATMYALFSARFLNMSLRSFLSEIIKPLVAPVLTLLVLEFLVVSHLPIAKSKLNLLIVLSAAILILLVTFIIHIVLSKKTREEAIRLFSVTFRSN